MHMKCFYEKYTLVDDELMVKKVVILEFSLGIQSLFDCKLWTVVEFLVKVDRVNADEWKIALQS